MQLPDSSSHSIFSALTAGLNFNRTIGKVKGEFLVVINRLYSVQFVQIMPSYP